MIYFMQEMHIVETDKNIDRLQNGPFNLNLKIPKSIILYYLIYLR